VVLADGAFQRLGLVRVTRIARNCAQEQRQRGIDGVAGGASIGAELLADIVDGPAAELLLKELE
jgi:hypothetical protein